MGKNSALMEIFLERCELGIYIEVRKNGKIVDVATIDKFEFRLRDKKFCIESPEIESNIEFDDFDDRDKYDVIEFEDYLYINCNNGIEYHIEELI